MKSAKQVTAGVELRVKVIPRSSKSEIVGEHNKELKIKLNSPPVDGAANKEVVKILAKEFGIAKGRVEIIRGIRDRSKVVLLSGLEIRKCERKLAKHLE